jgi:hypothetical protein
MAPDPDRAPVPAAAHPPAVASVLADPTLTEQERANIELVLRFRALLFVERAAYTVPGFRPSRFGMAGLAEVSTRPGPGYTAESVPDREDEMLSLIAHGDRVWATWMIRGTHKGWLYGIPATGRRIDVLEMGQWRIEDGLIAEAWFCVDELALARQLGAWAPVAPAGESDGAR